MERKEQERKKRQSVEFVSGGIQHGAGVPTPILSAQNSGKSSRLHLKKSGKVGLFVP